MKTPLPESALDKDNVECSVEFSHNDDNAGTHPRPSDEQEQIKIANDEDRLVGYWRIILVLVMVIVATGVSLAVYFLSRADERDDFHRAYDDHAMKVIESFRKNAAALLGAKFGQM
jgi:hypothetical protein